MDNRQAALSQWLQRQLPPQENAAHRLPFTLTMVSGDASFRRYFRVVGLAGGRTLIAVDAPPDKEDSRPFVAIARAWEQAGVAVPQVFAADFAQGFMLLSDLGDQLYLTLLNCGSADVLYQRALKVLVKIQCAPAPADYALPDYDCDRLLAEMQLCPDWFFTRLLGLELDKAERQLLQRMFELLAGSALAQPQVCVHRDFHSRNLMVLPGDEVGVLDFQDAVTGPVTYDLVSLLRDCYISWPASLEDRWVDAYLHLASRAGVWGQDEAPPRALFKRWFDWMGLQRHIKCVGIFSRLCLRDAKPGYLQDIPRTFGYLKSVCTAYPELADFDAWLSARVMPAMRDCEQLADIPAPAAMS